jgi:hypothetical protein
VLVKELQALGIYVKMGANAVEGGSPFDGAGDGTGGSAIGSAGNGIGGEE